MSQATKDYIEGLRDRLAVARCISASCPAPECEVIDEARQALRIIVPLLDAVQPLESAFKASQQNGAFDPNARITLQDLRMAHEALAAIESLPVK